MAINIYVIKEILEQVDKASPLGVEDETKISIKKANVSDEERRAYLVWLEAEGYIRFRVFGECIDNPKGTAKNIIITEAGINRLRS